MKSHTTSLARIVLALPLVLYAPLALAADPALASTAPGTLGNFMLQIIDFIDRLVVPLVFALAFIVFIWGAYTYFIAGGANEEKRQQGQQFVMYALIGFVLMFSVWGIINIVKNTLSLNNSRPDYPTFNTSSGGANASGGTGATLPAASGSDCQTTGCPANQTCQPISGSYACVTTQPAPATTNPAPANTTLPEQ